MLLSPAPDQAILAGLDHGGELIVEPVRLAARHLGCRGQLPDAETAQVVLL